jgi:HlyD family secretion protein
LDIPIEPASRRRRYVGASIAAAVVLLLTLGLAGLRPAAPTVERAAIWVDSVRRGTMVRELNGPGSLVPEHIRWISALTSARVEKILRQPGAEVSAQTVLLELSNPDVQIEALDAQRQLSAAEADLLSLGTTLENQRLSQAGVLATTRTQQLQARRDADVAEALGARGGIASNDVSLARDKAAELDTRYNIERQRLALLSAAVDSQLAAKRVEVDRLRAITSFQVSRVNSLLVRAGEDGVLQELPLQLGQWVVPGTILAKVVQPTRLKAALRISETQAKDLAIGESAVIDTHNGVVAGHVSRIDPAAQEGTVAVDVAFDGPLPPGARPDINVEGTITIERLKDVLYVGRPAYGQPNSTVTMFKLIDGGKYAELVPVRLGRASVNTVEVTRGLNAGDEVILSDMSRWSGVDRVRLK